MEEIKELPNTFLFKGYLKYKHLKLKTDFGSSTGGWGGEKRKANKDDLINSVEVQHMSEFFL